MKSLIENGVNLLSLNLSYIQNPEIQINFAREESSKHCNSCMIKNPVSPCGRPRVTIYSRRDILLVVFGTFVMTLQEVGNKFDIFSYFHLM